MIRLTDHKTRSTELMHAIDIEHRISLSQKVYIPDKVLLQSVIITYTGLDLLGEEGEGDGLGFGGGGRFGEGFAAGFGFFSTGVPCGPGLVGLDYAFLAEFVVAFFCFSVEPFLYAVG